MLEIIDKIFCLGWNWELDDILGANLRFVFSLSFFKAKWSKMIPNLTPNL
jgi:hypothetical protein